MGFAPLSRLSNGFDVPTFKSIEKREKQDREREARKERNKVPCWIRPEQCESEPAAGFGKSSSVFFSSILAGCISIKENKRRLQGVSGGWWLVIHQYTIGHRGGGAECSYLWSARLWLMESAFVSGVGQLVNKATLRVVKHGHSVGIKEYLLILLGWLTSNMVS